MKKPMTTKIWSVLLVVVMLLGMIPAVAAVPQMKENELNKMVGYYATTTDIERQGAVLSSDYVKDQTKTVKLDEKAGVLSIDFGYGAYVTRLELVSANATTALTGDDFEVYMGTENFGKVKMFDEGNEKRAQLGKLSKQDYEVSVSTVNGHAVLNFRFFGNAAGRYLVLQLPEASAS